MAPADATQRKIFLREFLCLWGAGTGLHVLTLWLGVLSGATLARQLWLPVHTQSTSLIVLADVVQNSFRLAIAVGAGLVVAGKIGLGVPILAAWFRHEPIRQQLRDTLIPIALMIAVLVAASALARTSLIHSRRTVDLAAINDFANSPEAPRALAELERLGLGGSKPVTRPALEIFRLSGAVDGELGGRLFEVSVIILLLVQISGGAGTTTDRRLVWTAVLIVALFRTAENVIVIRENTVLIMNVYRNYGLPYELPPIWTAWVQTGSRVIPSAVALGLLYVYRGLESSIIASYCVSFISFFWITHFR